MNKALTMALIAGLGLGLTSCLDESDNITQATVAGYNMVDAGDGVLTLSTSSTQFEVNNSTGTISSTINATLAPGIKANFSTGALQMTAETNGWSYGASSLPSTGAGVTNFRGKYEPNIGLIAWDYILNAEYVVHSVVSFGYNFSTMTVYDAPGGNVKFTTNSIAFGFVPQVDENKCVVVLSQFKKEENDNALSSTLSYGGSDDNVTYAMTAGGFTVQSNEASPSEGFTQYDVTNLKGTVTNFGQNATLSFSMGDDTYVEITGSMFYPVN